MLINPVPFFLRFVSGWPSIKAKVNDWAIANAYPTYDENPTAYRFSGWGSVGFPPRLACNVYFSGPDVDEPLDLGRFVA